MNLENALERVYGNRSKREQMPQINCPIIKEIQETHNAISRLSSVLRVKVHPYYCSSESELKKLCAMATKEQLIMANIEGINE